MAFIVAFLALLGLAISLYSYFVDRKLLENKNYKPVCDLSDRISCSKPFSTPYSTVLGISNTLLGILFYISMFWLAIGNYNKLMFLGATVSIIASVYLAYLLFFKVKSLCLICTSLYIINILLFVATFRYLS